MHDTVSAGHMRRAIALAIDNVRQGGGPFASLVVRNGVVIAEGVNRVTATHDPTAHAEVVAIRKACQELEDFQLSGCELYTTCEPCPMCLGAIYWARPDRVYYAADKNDAASAGFDDAFIYHEIDQAPLQRSIPMEQLLSEEARPVFRAWLDKEDRQEY